MLIKYAISLFVYRILVYKIDFDTRCKHWLVFVLCLDLKFHQFGSDFWVNTVIGVWYKQFQQVLPRALYSMEIFLFRNPYKCQTFCQQVYLLHLKLYTQITSPNTVSNPPLKFWDWSKVSKQKIFNVVFFWFWKADFLLLQPTGCTLHLQKSTWQPCCTTLIGKQTQFPFLSVLNFR